MLPSVVNLILQKSLNSGLLFFSGKLVIYFCFSAVINTIIDCSLLNKQTRPNASIENLKK